MVVNQNAIIKVPFEVTGGRPLKLFDEQIRRCDRIDKKRDAFIAKHFPPRKGRSYLAGNDPMGWARQTFEAVLCMEDEMPPGWQAANSKTVLDRGDAKRGWRIAKPPPGNGTLRRQMADLHYPSPERFYTACGSKPLYNKEGLPEALPMGGIVSDKKIVVVPARMRDRGKVMGRDIPGLRLITEAEYEQLFAADPTDAGGE